MSAGKLTLAAVVVFVLLVVAGALGFCGKPADHQTPKPNPSVSSKEPK